MTDGKTLNALIDAAALFDRSLSSDEAWLKSVDFMERRGFGALNVAEISNRDGSVLWFRSSMEEKWLDDYFQQGFLDVDPLFFTMRQGRTSVQTIEGKADGIEIAGKKLADLTDQVNAWGYGNLKLEIFGNRNSASKMGIVFCLPDKQLPVAEENRLICGMLASVVSAPNSPQSPGATPLLGIALSDREKDVLRYLASGLRNDEIAWRLGIAEVTVRAHSNAAREKLNAATREQAIAIGIKRGLLDL